MNQNQQKTNRTIIEILVAEEEIQVEEETSEVTAEEEIPVEGDNQNININ